MKQFTDAVDFLNAIVIVCSEILLSLGILNVISILVSAKDKSYKSSISLTCFSCMYEKLYLFHSNWLALPSNIAVIGFVEKYYSKIVIIRTVIKSSVIVFVLSYVWFDL